MEPGAVVRVDDALVRDVVTAIEAAVTGRALLRTGASPDQLEAVLEVVERRCRDVMQALDNTGDVVDLREDRQPR